MELEIRDKVFLWVAPMKGVMRFGKNGKLSPKFVGPFEVLERVGKVAYRNALPQSCQEFIMFSMNLFKEIHS